MKIFAKVSSKTLLHLNFELHMKCEKHMKKKFKYVGTIETFIKYTKVNKIEKNE